MTSTLATNTVPRVNGILDLQFLATPEGTRLAVQTQEPPLRVVRAFNAADGAALVHLHNVSGGVLGGDHLVLKATLAPNTEAQLTTPGATRIYKHRPGFPDAEQHNMFVLQENALLEYLPDPLIPFAKSRYRQTTTVTMADGAGLFWWETIAPGREAHQETFAYDLLEMVTDIHTEERPFALERMKLEPEKRPLTSPLRLGSYRYFTTFYICKVGLPASDWQSLEEALQQTAVSQSRPEATIWGVSTLPAHGLVVRGLSKYGRDLSSGVLPFWQTAKQQLYGREPILPRKQY